MENVVFDSRDVLKFAWDAAGVDRVEELLTACRNSEIGAFAKLRRAAGKLAVENGTGNNQS